ncbi:MAG: dienelactone hydrolase family protein [Myxococcota bacterium]
MTQRLLAIVPLLLAALLGTGCNNLIFPIWDEILYEEPPAELGPYAWSEYRVDVPDGANGEPTAITVFEPELAAATPAPSLFWVLGSNVRAYYHQSLHETLASWGYVVVVSDGLPLTYGSRKYHRRTVDLVKQAMDLALAGEVTDEVPLDPERMAIGGYSIGGPMAVFTAAERPDAAAVVLWAPSGAPFWQGLRPKRLYPEVSQDVLMLLGELDRAAPPEGGFPDKLIDRMTAAGEIDKVVIDQGTHTQFQQPVPDNEGDSGSSLTRFEQQGIAITETRAYLDERFDVVR